MPTRSLTKHYSKENKFYRCLSMCLQAYAICVPKEKNVLFEGAQGTLLDLDHGTYPFVTSSNTSAGGAACGTGVGPQEIDYVLGITKAYTTRVGAGPFPTELTDAVGQRLGERGAEFGATTGRARRCGWLDVVTLKRVMDINSVNGLCITKLDVLDGLETLKICTAYKYKGEVMDTVPLDAETLRHCEPIYEEIAGWSESTVGATQKDALPGNARAYIARIEALLGRPVVIVSTGPEREENVWFGEVF